MPHKCSDSFAWYRVVLSALKPSKNTQLVLCAHLKYMNRDGTRCRVSVRRLAVDLSLNKDTIAACRKHAIEEGWLIVGGSLRSTYREFYPAIPDRIVAKYPELLSDQAGQLLSGLARQQIMYPTAAQPSEETSMRVRNGPPISPTGSDKSPIPLLTSEDLRADIRLLAKSMECPDLNQMNERLRSWLESSQNVQKYQHDPQALALLTPLAWRFPGYEGVIRQWCANLGKPS